MESSAIQSTSKGKAMKHLILSAALLSAMLASPVLAEESRCDVPKAEWQPQKALQDKLEAEGWKVKQIKEDGGCYEVYGFNAKGERQEAYFHPKTLEFVSSVED
jgi:hypothetical protein